MGTPASATQLVTAPALSWDDCGRLFESVSDHAIILLDRDGRVVSWSSGAKAILGYARDEILGEHVSRFYAPEAVYTRKAERELAAAIERGSVEDDDWRMRKDGSRFWASVVLTALRDEAGAVRGFAKVTRVRERRDAHGELIARAGELLGEAFDYEHTLHNVVQLTLPVLADVAFFDVVEEREVRRIAAAYGDPALDRLIKATRWTRSARTDKNICALSSGETGFHPEIDDAWMLDVALGPDHLALLRALRLRSMVTVPLRARGEVLGSLTLCFGASGRQHTAEDVRLAEELARRAAMALLQVRLYEAAQQSAKRAEEAARRAEEASRLKDEFLATVSHELRTPLNAILGWATLLRARGLEPSIAKGIDVIHRNAEAQARLVEDILDVSRIVTGKLGLALEPTDLVTTVKESIEVLRPSASAKEIAIELGCANEHAVLVGDPARLRQVVWNLLSNAVKFTDPGGKVTISMGQEGSTLVLSVRDTGRGIDQDFLPYVFDRFKQADGSTTRRFGGLGLGLAIVRHIVELHGGSVQAESAGSGRGAIFTVRLPVRAVLADEPARAAESDRAERRALPPPISLAGLRVLVVDDDDDARDLLEDVLVAAGAVVEKADSAARGLEKICAFRPQVLVSDIGMPGEDGYAFVQRVRAVDGAIPSIALTAYTRSEDRTKALAAGFTTHIGKPVNPDDLVAAVANLATFGRR
jgi:PAS domain S-box-containing protein